MTSTSFNVGLTDNTRLSSRVLRPPGGGHTDIFGGEPEQPAPRRQPPAATIASIVGQEGPKPTNGTTDAPSQNGQQSSVEQSSEPAARPAPEPKQDTPSPVRSEPAPVRSEPAPQPKADPPKRVRVPPGGFSSGLW